MSILGLVQTAHGNASSIHSLGPWQAAYNRLLATPEPGSLDSREFLDARLAEVGELEDDLPDSPEHLLAWSRQHAEAVTRQYATYLAGRREGEPRRYFSSRAHALYFLRSVAPTKLVDGAWLYGTLPHWRDIRMQPLVRTYLEELGDGIAGQNHVLMYRRLLATQGCDDLADLDDALYLQGAIQLALGLQADHLLPEVIGYNLGYEQLPLHLLISSFELQELGIDPCYFLLHVTIDNSASGHAAKAVRAVLDNVPLFGNRKAFYQRVRMGYRLNDLGIGSCSVINGFDLEQELHAMFERKRSLAGQVHSDYCRIEGRTVNQWLSASGSMGGFLDALQRRGWITRHADPEQSRFWGLVQGEGAAMFGVFSPYEQQLIHDWIAGDWLQGRDEKPFRRLSTTRTPLPATPASAPDSELEAEVRELEQQLRRMAPTQREVRLIELLAPLHHPTSAGLAATRTFSALTR